MPALADERHPASREQLLSLLATTTSRFIIQPASGIGEATQAMLRDIGELFDVDRAYLFEIESNGDTMSNTVEWCAPGVDPAIEGLQSVPVEIFAWWMEQMRADHPIRLTTLDDLPPEAVAEREILEPQGIQSLLVLPVALRGEVAGFVGFDHVRGARDWADDEVSVLRFIGSALAHALERQRLDEHLERAATVFDSAQEALIVTDADQRIIEVNPAFTAITGYKPQDAVDHELLDLLVGPDTDPAVVATLREAARAGSPVDAELLAYAKDGTAVWLELRGNPLRTRTGAVHGHMAIASDVTDRKRNERMKSEFVSTVSHELRTPLTAIKGSLGLMRGGAAGDLGESARDILDLADRNVERLTHLVEDLLDMEKLGHTRVDMPLADHDAMELVDDAVVANQMVALRFGVELRVTERAEGAVIHVNALRLQQILANLLSNAAKFSPAGADVDVAVRRDGDRVAISVTDRGPGVPPEFRDRIFEKFAMADASDSRRRGGTGLGLAIAKALTERMDGTLTFVSPPGEGATFTITLPSGG